MTSVEQRQEIFEVLQQICETYGAGPTETHLKRLASTLLPLHGVDLFKFLWTIPQEYKTFPTDAVIEKQAKIAFGIIDTTRGITEDMIAKNTEQLKKSGVSQEVIDKGAVMFKQALGHKDVKPAPPPAAEVDELSDFSLLDCLDSIPENMALPKEWKTVSVTVSVPNGGIEDILLDIDK